VPAAGTVPELRGSAGVFDLLAATVVRRVRLRRGAGDDDQAVPRVRVVDRNGHDLGEPPGVLVSGEAWFLWSSFFALLIPWTVVLVVMAFRPDRDLPE
jgi:hypothetical protein